MPPVLGPRSPSKTRLWSWAGARGTARVPSHTTWKLASSPGRQLLEHHRGPRVAELAPAHQPVDGLARLVDRARDDHPLACREPVGLHDQRTPRAPHVPLRRARVVEDREARGGDAVALAEALHEGLGGLQARGGPRGTERADAPVLERVDEPPRQRQLGPDEDEVGTFGHGQGDEALDVVALHGRVPAHGRRARVARCGDDAMPRRREGAREGVLPRPASHDDDRRACCSTGRHRAARTPALTRAPAHAKRGACAV